MGRIRKKIGVSAKNGVNVDRVMEAEKLVEALGKTFESLKKKDGGYELLSVNKE